MCDGDNQFPRPGESDTKAAAHRAAVMEVEPLWRKALRWVCFIGRGVPMGLIFVGWPIFLSLYILDPSISAQRAAAWLLAHSAAVVAFQLFGTVRAGASWAAKRKAGARLNILAHAPRPPQWRWATRSCNHQA